MQFLEKFSDKVLNITLEIENKKSCHDGYKFFDKEEKEISEKDLYCNGINPNDDDELKEEKITKKEDKTSFAYGTKKFKILSEKKSTTIVEEVSKKYLEKKDDKYRFYYLDNQDKKDGIELVFDNDGKIIEKNYYLNGEKFTCKVDFFENGAQLSNIDNYTLTCPDDTIIKIKGTTGKIEKIMRNGEEIIIKKPLKAILKEAEKITLKKHKRNLSTKNNHIFLNINAKTDNSQPSFF